MPLAVKLAVTTGSHADSQDLPNYCCLLQVSISFLHFTYMSSIALGTADTPIHKSMRLSICPARHSLSFYTATTMTNSLLIKSSPV